MSTRDEATATILNALATGPIPSAVPADCDYAEELSRLVASLAGTRRVILALGSGDFSTPVDGTGPLAEALASLRTSMLRVLRQTKQAAAGDYSQQVEAMGEFSHVFNGVVQRLKEVNDELVHVGNHDGLTGLYNRTFFDAEYDRMSRGRTFPISFIVADINGLKLANDRRGNAVGDELITRAGELLRRQVRADDVLARVGGDEFVMLLPHADAAASEMILNRIRTAMAKEAAGGEDLPVSLSLGSGTAPKPERMADALKEADDRMTLDKAAHYLK